MGLEEEVEAGVALGLVLVVGVCRVLGVLGLVVCRVLGVVGLVGGGLNWAGLCQI